MHSYICSLSLPWKFHYSHVGFMHLSSKPFLNISLMISISLCFYFLCWDMFCLIIQVQIQSLTENRSSFYSICGICKIKKENKTRKNSLNSRVCFFFSSSYIRSEFLWAPLLLSFFKSHSKIKAIIFLLQHFWYIRSCQF